MELKQKLEEENNVRNDLDDELARLRKDVDDATMVHKVYKIIRAKLVF